MLNRNNNPTVISGIDGEGTVETRTGGREGVVERVLYLVGTLKEALGLDGFLQMTPIILEGTPGAVEKAVGYAAKEAGYDLEEEVSYEVIIRVKRKG